MTETPWAIAGRARRRRQCAAVIGGHTTAWARTTRVVYDKHQPERLRPFPPRAPTRLHPRRKATCRPRECLALGRAASFLYGAPNCSRFPLLEGSQIPHLYYCDPLEAKDPLGNLIQPTTYVDITEQVEKKAEMLACHVSQRQWLLDHHGIDEYVNAMRRHAGDARQGNRSGRRPRRSSSHSATPIRRTTCSRNCSGRKVPAQKPPPAP